MQFYAILQKFPQHEYFSFSGASARRDALPSSREVAELHTPEDSFRDDGQRGQPSKPFDVLPVDACINRLSYVHSQSTIFSKVFPWGECQVTAWKVF